MEGGYLVKNHDNYVASDPRKRLILFFITAYGITWLVWLPIVLNKRLGMNIPLIPYQYYLASFGPMLSAIIVSFIYGGPGELRSFLKRSFNFKLKAKWYIFAFGSPLVLFLIAALIGLAMEDSWPDITKLGISQMLPGFGVLESILFWILTYGLGEETGWRGYALPELQKRFTSINAGAIIGFMWCLWHLPAFFMNENYMTMGIIGVFGWSVSLLFGSMFLTWLYNSSGRSVIIVGIWHALFDAFITSDISAGITGGVMSAAIIIFSIFIMKTQGPHLKYPFYSDKKV